MKSDKYYILNFGEIIRKTDEYSHFDDTWYLNHGCEGQKNSGFSKWRRRIKTNRTETNLKQANWQE